MCPSDLSESVDAPPGLQVRRCNDMRKILCGFCVVAALAGCGGASQHAARQQQAAPREATAAKYCSAAARPLGSIATAYVAIVRHRTAAFRSPGGPVLARFGHLNR